MNRTGSKSEIAELGSLLSAKAVRERARFMLNAALSGKLSHFSVAPERLAPTADFVISVIRASYPSLAIPYHSRLRHFGVGGRDRVSQVSSAIAKGKSQEASVHERGRVLFDLITTSVLLDAGAGSRWSYREPDSGKQYARSEGLAVASFDMFSEGSFSSEPKAAPFRADGEALAKVDAKLIARAFQVSDANPLLGLEGRASLLARLGQTVLADPDHFGSDCPRPGGLFDFFLAHADHGVLKASFVLETILAAMGPIWPGRIERNGVNLGDTWQHPAIDVPGPTNGLVPFHKLSQWLSYSLIEALELCGVKVEGMNELTGLAEYRNGGLFVDSGVLQLRDQTACQRPHSPASELIVEWRALTVALLDELSAIIRDKLEMTADELPLARILEGGTWQAGRKLAIERRSDGSPPLSLASDGTVF